MPPRLGSPVSIGILGDNVQSAADSLATTGAHILGVTGPEFSASALFHGCRCRRSALPRREPTIVIAPPSSRARALPGVAYRLNGATETHITGLNTGQSKDLTVIRWFIANASKPLSPVPPAPGSSFRTRNRMW